MFCKDNRVRTSVGRTGVCWDNAAAESFFAALKNECYHRQHFPTRARARFAVADYIEVFYNRQRLHSTLGYRTPVEALTDHPTAALRPDHHDRGPVQDPTHLKRRSAKRCRPGRAERMALGAGVRQEAPAAWLSWEGGSEVTFGWGSVGWSSGPGWVGVRHQGLPR